MRRNGNHALFFIFLSFAALFPLSATAETPREAYDRARSLSPGEAAAVLEANLAASMDLRPFYLLELTRLAAEGGDWKAALSWSERQDFASLPGVASDAVAYWYALALDATGQTAKGVKVAKDRIDTGLVRDPLVYLAYFRIASALSEETIARFDRAFPVLKNTDPAAFALSRYLSGLCAVREGNWAFAALSFSRFSPSRDEAFPDLAPWSHYYLAYSQYRLGKWEDAIAGFSAYLSAWKTHSYAWQAAITASLAAIQAKSDPLPFVDRAVALASSASDLGYALVLRATILFDRKLYAEADTVLAGVADGSSTRGLTASAARAQFMRAEIAVRLKKGADAEALWLSILARFPRDPLAEESLYRAGELRYLDGEWARASELLTRYRQTWPSGRFLDAVLSLGGDALYRNGSIDLAIIWWEDLVKKYPTSQTLPRTYGNLVAAYRAKGEFANAVRAAEGYRAKFPAEAELDGIAREIGELTRLLGGDSADSAALAGEWAQSGRATTEAGRAAGVALARRYLADYGKRSEARDILREITARPPKSPESLSASDRGTFASAWALLGNLLREDNDPKAAAQALLNAGTLYAAIDGERSAEALYGAVDGFLQAGLGADARTTLETLEKKWPDSAWTKRAGILVER